MPCLNEIGQGDFARDCPTRIGESDVLVDRAMNIASSVAKSAHCGGASETHCLVDEDVDSPDKLGASLYCLPVKPG